MSNFRDRLRTLKSGLWYRPILRSVSPDAHSGMVASVFGTARCSRIRKWFYLLLQHFHWFFRWRCFFCQDVTDHCTLAESADSPLFTVTTPHHLCSRANMAWDRLVSVGRMLTIFGFWRAGQTAPTFISHVSKQVKRAGFDVHDLSLASGSADVLGYEGSPAHFHCSGAGSSTALVRSVARTVSSHRRISGRAMEVVSGHESFLARSNRGLLRL